MKDVGLRIRIDRDLREQFVRACQADDKPASQVIREFMRDYVRQHNELLRENIYKGHQSENNAE